MKLHTYAWIAWLLSGLVLVSSTRNPLYLILLILVLWIVQSSLRQTESRMPISTLKFSISVLLLSSVLNAFISHFGETILFNIPGNLPVISGAITLEAVMYGAINGLVLIAMFTFFTILNSAVPIQNLVRLIPQAFHPVAVVTTIALTFIPATQQQYHAIRDAQAMRGQRLTKLRDWLPLFVPLLIGGLERAMQIAEAMTARGYSIQPVKKAYPWHKIVLPLALLLIIIGWLMLISSQATVMGWLLISTGIILMTVLFIISGRRIPKTRFHAETWNVPSLLVVLAAIIPAVITLLPFPGTTTLRFDPYPRMMLPSIAILQVVANLLLILPAMYKNGSSHAED